MKVSFVLVGDPSVAYFEDGRQVALMNAAVIETDEFKESCQVLIVVSGDTVETVAEYARSGRFCHAELASLSSDDVARVVADLHEAFDPIDYYEGLTVFYASKVAIDVPKSVEDKPMLTDLFEDFFYLDDEEDSAEP